MEYAPICIAAPDRDGNISKVDIMNARVRRQIELEGLGYDMKKVSFLFIFENKF